MRGALDVPIDAAVRGIWAATLDRCSLSIDKGANRPANAGATASVGAQWSRMACAKCVAIIQDAVSERTVLNYTVELHS